MRATNFNGVAFIYDALARLVFGRAIVSAQICFLRHIPANASVLMVGGGSGWILKELDKLGHPLHVCYVEPSSAMLKKAMAGRPYQFLTVDFIEGQHDIVEETLAFDILITNFFLDLFTDRDLPCVMKHLSNRLKITGSWLCTDFVSTQKRWQHWLIKLMYWFFRLTAGVEGYRLLDFDRYFKQLGLKEEQHSFFYHGMIKSSVYRLERVI